MSSARALAALAAIAIALGAWLWVDVARGPDERAAGARLLPRLIDEEPVRIEIARAGSEAVVLERKGDGWQLRAPVAVAAEPAAVGALVGALELLESRRASERELPGERGRVQLWWADGGRAELIVGAETAGGALAWVRRGDDQTVHAVDAHGVSEILLGAAALRARRPFAGVGAVRAVEVERDGQGGRIELAPPRVRIGGGWARADARAARAVATAAASLAIARFGDRAAPGPRARITVAGTRGDAALVIVDGFCGDGQRHVDTAIGAGCAPGAQLDELLSIATEPEALVDRQLVPDEAVTRIEIARGGQRAAVELGPEEQPAARRWGQALRVSLTGAIAPAPAGAPIAAATVTAASGRRVALALHQSGGRLSIRRDQEPVALVATDAARALFAPAPDRFRDLELLAAETTQIRALTWRRGGETVAAWRRGELLEDWRDAAGRPVDAAQVAPVLAALTPLRAQATGAEPGAAAVELEIEIADPLGQKPPARHRFRLAGCAIQRAGASGWMQLGRERCRALSAPGR